MKICCTTISVLLIFLTFPDPICNAQTRHGTWPQWRGSDWSSTSSETGLPKSFKPENRLWRFELPGPGGASPIVWEDQIFVSSVDGEKLVLLCIGTDGKQRWRAELAGRNQQIQMDRANSASPSPVTDGKHVWVMMTDGILHCFDMLGQLKWQKKMQEEYGTFNIQFGMTSTPILDKGRLYFQFIHGDFRDRSQSGRGKIVCLNAADGTEHWVHERKTDGLFENKHAYTSPTIFRNDQREFLIIHGGDYTTGHSLENGEELWRLGGLNPKGDSYNPFLRFVSSPTAIDNLVVVPSAKNGPVIGVSPEISGTRSIEDAAVKWKMKRGTPDVATPVISGNRVFLVRENGVVICLDAESGQKHFQERVVGPKHRSTPVAADGRIYIAGRDGRMAVVADADEYRLISLHDLEEDTTASPAIAGGVIYVRTNESLMAFGKAREAESE